MKTLLYASIIALCAGTSVSMGASPQKPHWMKAKLKPGEAIAKGITLEEARHLAIADLLNAVQLPADSDTCLFNTLKWRSIPIDPTARLIDEAMQSSSFVTSGIYQPSDTDSVTVLVKMTPTSLAAFNDSLYDISFELSIDKTVQAREYRGGGDLLAACRMYHEAMQQIVPCMYSAMPTEEGDLGEVLLEEYASLFDHITITYDHEQCPMVAGEEVPVPIKLTARQDSLILKNLPVKVWMRQRDAVINAPTHTDKNGTLTIQLTTAPKTEKASLLAALDVFDLDSLPVNYATPLLKQHLQDSLRQFSMNFVSFDPTPLYRLDIDPCDTLQALLPLRQMLSNKEAGLVEAQDPESADISIRLAYEAKEGVPIKAGNFKIRQDTCSLALILHDIYFDRELLRMSINDFTIKVAENRSPEKARELAMREMLKRMFAETQDKLPQHGFDKRKVVYERDIH